MKYELPDNHGLSQLIQDNYLFYDNEQLQLTDAQYKSLEEGVAHGVSQLVVSPTSTGKTQIAVWAMVSALQKGKKCVYLVTHRALAKQKFEDFDELFKKSLFHDDSSAIVLATGDYVVDAEGEAPPDPLSAPIVVATYEKYLAMIAAAGIPSSMENIVFICDEVQLLGDPHRGTQVEILITLLKNSGWFQFLGLSAVLDNKDADDLCNWLSIKKISAPDREKNLVYECWTSKGVFSKSTGKDHEVKQLDSPISQISTINIVEYLLKNNKASFPIIVFCMRKKDVYDLAEIYENTFFPNSTQQFSLVFEDLPVTKANTDLARYLPNRFAIHCADLTEEERDVVENALLDGSIDIVFSTSTLAAGVNFPLGMAVFHTWKRWDSDLRQYQPIDPSEFHNMSGRVGRMGTEHEEGRIIFSTDAEHELMTVGQYFDFDKYSPIPVNFNGSEFKQITLQLIASGIAKNQEQLSSLMKSTFSGLKTQDSNIEEFNKWDDYLSDAIIWNSKTGFILEDISENLVATPLGRSIAQSAMLVETGMFLIEYFLFSDKGKSLINYYLTSDSNSVLDVVDYVLIYLFASSPEFHGYQTTQKSRFLPWQLEQGFIEPPTQEAIPYLSGDDWRYLPSSLSNAAFISGQWMWGKKIYEIEIQVQDLNAGSIFELFRNLKWIAQGAAQILSVLTDKKNQLSLQLSGITVDDQYLFGLRTIIRHIYNLSSRLTSGVPNDVQWMFELNKFDGANLSRDEIIHLRELGVIRIEDAMRGDQEIEAHRNTVFQKAKPAPQVKSTWFRDSCRVLKNTQREGAKERQSKRAKQCPQVQLINDYYTSLGNDFESVFEKILVFLNIAHERLDNKDVIGAPDYLVHFSDEDKIVVELKSKQGDKLVDYNGSTEVLAASEVHGHKDTYCVTLCQPGVDPSVAPAITRCTRLTVIESVDLGEALLRLCEGKISVAQMYEWLTRPGQALKDDLPYGVKEVIF